MSGKTIPMVCWSGSSTSSAELLYFALQVRSSLFEHGTVTFIAAALKLLKHSLERQTKALFLVEPRGGFPCQTRLCGCASSGRFVLLCLDGLAFPAPGHEVSITFREWH